MKFPRVPAAASGALLLAAVLCLVLLPNPLLDSAVSLLCRMTFGIPVVLHQVRVESVARVSFKKMELWPNGHKGPVLATEGRLAWNGRRRVLELRARDIDWTRLAEEDAAGTDLVRRYELDKWLVLRSSHWTLKRKGPDLLLRLLRAEAGGSSLKGGARFVDGRMSRAAAALWLPSAIWRRFPSVVEKRFAQDSKGRRFFKLTWSEGLWRLWGRSAPVLEARWS